MSLAVNDYIKYDLYQVFLLTKNNFNTSLLRKAYQRQVLIFHPDKFAANLSESDQKEKMDFFLLINNAYTILSNENTRKEYDDKREDYVNEQKGFGSLKSQFLADKKKYTVSSEDLEAQRQKAELQFKMNMEEMNSELEKQAISINKEIVENINITSTLVDGTSEKLMPVSVKPSDNFDNELSNITTNRNMKIENDGTNLYNGLHSSKNMSGSSISGLDYSTGITEKYAFINEAFN
jgi:hypothetical protein